MMSKKVSLVYKTGFSHYNLQLGNCGFESCIVSITLKFCTFFTLKKCRGKDETEVIIQEIERLKDMINQMTPATLVPILEEQKEKWLDDKTLESTAENYAQTELNKSEFLKHRKMAAKKCTKAIEMLQKQADEEEKTEIKERCSWSNEKLTSSA